MGRATIWIEGDEGRTQHVQPGKPVHGHVGYDPQGGPKPTDVHVAYTKLGSDDWHPVMDLPTLAPGLPINDLPVTFTAPEPGTYDFRVTWTFDGVPGKPAPSTVTGQFFVESKCFVATAAYGSPLAPQVQFLRGIRDGELKETAWGREFFADFDRYYYRISPAIAEEMRADPKLRALIRWSIVTPLVNYLQLAATQPDWDRIDLESLPHDVARFLRGVRAGLDEWLSTLALPDHFQLRHPLEAARELAIVLRCKRWGATAFLNGLIRRGELPLICDEEQRTSIDKVLQQAGCSRAQRKALLDGVPLPEAVTADRGQRAGRGSQNRGSAGAGSADRRK